MTATLLELLKCQLMVVLTRVVVEVDCEISNLLQALPSNLILRNTSFVWISPASQSWVMEITALHQRVCEFRECNWDRSSVRMKITLRLFKCQPMVSMYHSWRGGYTTFHPGLLFELEHRAGHVLAIVIDVVILNQLLRGWTCVPGAFIGWAYSYEELCGIPLARQIIDTHRSTEQAYNPLLYRDF
jgi:hypothetical protein